MPELSRNMTTKILGISVRKAVKGWTYSMMAMCDDGDGYGEYPDSLWPGDGYDTYDKAWKAAQEDAKNHKTVVLGEKKTQTQLDEEEDRDMLTRALPKWTNQRLL